MNINKTTSTLQDISIIICSKGRHNLLEKTVTHLQSIITQNKYLEIILIEETNNPKPLTGSKLKYYAIPERNRGLGFTRNTGLKKACGSIIVFIDDDILPCKNWFNNLITPFKDNNIGAVGGTILPDISHLNTIGKCVSYLGFPAGGLKRYLESAAQNYETNLISTGSCAFRSELARSVGGFDELLRNGEDTEFFIRISEISKTIFVPNAIVFHKQRDTLVGVFRWFIKRGRGRFLRACKQNIHPFLSIILPLRGNFFLKLFCFSLTVFFLLLFSPYLSLIFAISAYSLWNTLLWKRGHQLHCKSVDGLNVKIVDIKNSITTKDVMILLPIVKFCMDIGREIGKITAFFRYINHRIFSKPFVLCQ